MLIMCQVLLEVLYTYCLIYPQLKLVLSLTLFYEIYRSLLKLMSIELVMPSNHIFLCCPFLLLPSIFLSIRVFSNELALRIRYQIIGDLAPIFPMNIQDWFPLGLTGLSSSKSKGLSRVFSSTTIWKHQFLGPLAFFIVHLSPPYMTTGKTIAWTVHTFVGKVISLLFNMLSRFVIAFLPRSKCF